MRQPYEIVREKFVSARAMPTPNPRTGMLWERDCHLHRILNTQKHVLPLYLVYIVLVDVQRLMLFMYSVLTLSTDISSLFVSDACGRYSLS